MQEKMVTNAKQLAKISLSEAEGNVGDMQSLGGTIRQSSGCQSDCCSGGSRGIRVLRRKAARGGGHRARGRIPASGGRTGGRQAGQATGTRTSGQEGSQLAGDGWVGRRHTDGTSCCPTQKGRTIEYIR
ncbi:unnamed protein product [Protopolystoma xenopodis]|uniref:Uncharacterized protein n=1 Tax=Protopolystoma xenopodis TaxID=117903 RepID=A0A3S5AAY3_9PLAT|nr:unnamed protein product [Protopolystoma xenopodis]